MSSPIDNTIPRSSTDGRRRSSNSGLFNNLLSQKRSPENAARRQSIQDQGAKPGVLGSMWNTMVKGVGPNGENK